MTPGWTISQPGRSLGAQGCSDKFPQGLVGLNSSEKKGKTSFRVFVSVFQV